MGVREAGDGASTVVGAAESDRRRRNRDLLPDAWPGTRREERRGSPPFHHLVRQPRGRDRKRGLSRPRRGTLPRAPPELSRELHRLEAPVGEIERARSLRADSQGSPAGGLSRAPFDGTSRDDPLGPLRGNLLGLRGKARRRLPPPPLRGRRGPSPRGGPDLRGAGTADGGGGARPGTRLRDTR